MGKQRFFVEFRLTKDQFASLENLAEDLRFQIYSHGFFDETAEGGYGWDCVCETPDEDKRYKIIAWALESKVPSIEMFSCENESKRQRKGKLALAKTFLKS